MAALDITALTLPAIPAGEAAPFYGGYLAAVPDGRVGLHLQAQITEVEALCGGLDNAEAAFRYADGKWTVKEVLGHVIDAERIFACRLLRIARGDATPLAGFDEKLYVPAGDFNARDIGDLVSEFVLQRASTLALAGGLPAAAWPRLGEANGHPTSARALAYVIIGHTAHHLGVLRERYGLRPRR